MAVRLTLVVRNRRAKRQLMVFKMTDEKDKMRDNGLAEKGYSCICRKCLSYGDDEYGGVGAVLFSCLHLGLGLSVM